MKHATHLSPIKSGLLALSAVALSFGLFTLNGCVSSTNEDREAETVEAAIDAEKTYGDPNAVEDAADASTEEEVGGMSSADANPEDVSAYSQSSEADGSMDDEA